jgi:hypothetical protein
MTAAYNLARKLIWFSSGAASAIMAKLILSEEPEAIVVQCDMGESEDEDNRRFTADCVRWFNAPVKHISSAEYLNIDEVFEDKRYHANHRGAPCTGAMKRVPRLEFQQPGDVHYFGYTADARDVERAKNFAANSPGLILRFPLIERGLTKQACFALLEQAEIKRPRIYDWGYPNGNCPGCVKASSPDYWALVRLRHPDVFARRADQCRRFGSRLTRINDERIFIDEIPADWPILNPTVPSCDFLCHLAGQDLAA